MNSLFNTNNNNNSDSSKNNNISPAIGIPTTTTNTNDCNFYGTTTATVVEEPSNQHQFSDDNNNNNTNTNSNDTKVGIRRLPPNQTLSGGSVEETFKKIFLSSSPDKDVFVARGAGSGVWFWFALGVIFFLASIVCFVLVAYDKFPASFIVLPVYGFCLGGFGIVYVLLIGDEHFEIDKRDKVIRVKKHFTKLDCLNNKVGCTKPQEIKLEDVDYVTVQGVVDGFFDDDFVEFYDEEKKTTQRLPVKVARRRQYEQDERKRKEKEAKANATTTIVDMKEKSSTTEKTAGEESSLLVKGSDEWLRTQYYKPQGFDHENPQQPVSIRLFRRDAHANHILTNNKEHNNKILKMSSIDLERVSPDTAEKRLKDWEAYLYRSGCTNIRRTVPSTKFLDRRLLNSYDNQVEEISTTVSLDSGKTFLCVIIPSMLLYFGMLSMVLVFGAEAKQRQESEEAAWNSTGEQLWNATKPKFDADLTTSQGISIGVVGIAISVWLVIVFWFFLRKVTLIVNKNNRTFTYKIRRYLCNFDCLCFGEDEREFSFKFDNVHNIELTINEEQTSSCRRSLASRVLKINYRSTNSNESKSVIVESGSAGSMNSALRAWKRLFVEDLKIPLNHQEEDEAFAKLKEEDENGSNKKDGDIPKAKPFDPSLYVQDDVVEDAEESPMIHAY